MNFKTGHPEAKADTVSSQCETTHLYFKDGSQKAKQQGPLIPLHHHTLASLLVVLYFYLNWYNPFNI